MNKYLNSTDNKSNVNIKENNNINNYHNSNKNNRN